MGAMIYHTIAVNVPLPPLTYAHPTRLPVGTRVLVPFRNKTAVGVVWGHQEQPDIDPSRILAVAQVFDGEPPLPKRWLALIAFAASYYHYPIGQTLFAALPQGLREGKAVTLPETPLRYVLVDAGKAAPPAAHKRRQLALWEALHTPQTVAQLRERFAPSVFKPLLEQWQEQGYLNVETVSDSIIPPCPMPLNAEQQAAVDAVRAELGGHQVFLLHGITGSGKTEVYFELMAEVLAAGKQVLFLLPEINLTPQLLQRVSRRFGDIPTAVLHSRAAATRRTADYLRAMTAQAKLIIGTRLSVFTPLPSLGLVVVDEEHDASFKQDNELRYHARDLAVWRAWQAGCPIVLGSATPSLESWHHAQSGKYRLLTLPHRAVAAAVLPEIGLLDTRNERLDNGFSPRIIKRLQQNFAAGGLSMVYLNRRGFSPALFCGDCGYTFGCPHCSAKMVLHRHARQLRCHHCDFRQPVPVQCPDCGNQDLTALGQGTQRVEETLRQMLPEARIARVDRDSTTHQGDWQELYHQIAEQRVDILVGTQMLAKGHDFSRLNLVVVLNADHALFSTDYRATERLFAELVQVAGRAGRAERRGQVWIQTRFPNHPVMAAVQTQDFARFAERELHERRTAGLPPYGFQAAIRADAPQLEQAVQFLNQAVQTLAPMLPEHVLQFGPVPMLMARLAGRERAQVFVESASRRALHQVLAQWQAYLSAAARDHRLRWSIDVDPQEM